MVHSVFSRVFRSRRRQLLAGAGATWLLTLAGAAHAAAKRGNAWLGVAMSRGPAGGVVVDFVFKSSPADKASIQRGDMLVSADKIPLDRPSDLVQLVKQHKPGMSLELVVRRGGRESKRDVVLESHPGEEEVVRLMHVGNQAYDPRGLMAVQRSVPHQMKDLRGRVVLVDFFAAWCSNCKALAPQLAKWHRRFEGRGLTVLGISGDKPDVARQTVREWKIPYAVGSDPSQQTQAVYRVSAIPAMYVVGRKGIIREVLIGYDPTRAPETEKLIEKLLAEH